MRVPRPIVPLLFFGALPLAAAITRGEPRLVSGYYTVGWEVQSFEPCGGGRWWVSNPGPLMAAYREVVEGEYGTVFATVRAEVSDPGLFGHLGLYRRAMAVHELLEVRRPASGRGDCRELVEAE
jgi:hypothetical protein